MEDSNTDYKIHVDLSRSNDVSTEMKHIVTRDNEIFMEGYIAIDGIISYYFEYDKIAGAERTCAIGKGRVWSDWQKR